MTDKERITEVLKAYTKKHNISASVVILEEYAEELIRQGVTMPIRCKDCKYYKAQKQSVNWKNKKKYCCRVVALKVNENDYCSYGERKCE